MKKIDAIEMVRNIRDKHSAETAGKSPQEIIDYFRKKAAKIVKEVEAPSKH